MGAGHLRKFKLIAIGSIMVCGGVLFYRVPLGWISAAVGLYGIVAGLRLRERE